jgi:opacity protein-like surface antigen
MIKRSIFALAMLAFVAFSSTTVSAQSFEQGKSYVSLGYGFGNLSKALVKAAATASGTDSKLTSVGPVFAKYEYGVSEKVGLGLNLAYIGVKLSDDYSSGGTTYTESISYNSLSVLARVNFHFATGDKIDPYFGIGAGYKTGGWKFKSTDSSYVVPVDLKGGGIGFETTLGIRYLITDMIGLYAEVGVAKAPVQVGLVAKF